MASGKRLWCTQDQSRPLSWTASWEVSAFYYPGLYGTGSMTPTWLALQNGHLPLSVILWWSKVFVLCWWCCLDVVLDVDNTNLLIYVLIQLVGAFTHSFTPWLDYQWAKLLKPLFYPVFDFRPTFLNISELNSEPSHFSTIVSKDTISGLLQGSSVIQGLRWWTVVMGLNLTHLTCWGDPSAPESSVSSHLKSGTIHRHRVCIRIPPINNNNKKTLIKLSRYEVLLPVNVLSTTHYGKHVHKLSQWNLQFRCSFQSKPRLQMLGSLPKVG